MRAPGVSTRRSSAPRSRLEHKCCHKLHGAQHAHYPPMCNCRAPCVAVSHARMALSRGSRRPPPRGAKAAHRRAGEKARASAFARAHPPHSLGRKLYYAPSMRPALALSTMREAMARIEANLPSLVRFLTSRSMRPSSVSVRVQTEYGRLSRASVSVISTVRSSRGRAERDTCREHSTRHEHTTGTEKSNG